MSEDHALHQRFERLSPQERHFLLSALSSVRQDNHFANLNQAVQDSTAPQHTLGGLAGGSNDISTNYHNFQPEATKLDVNESVRRAQNLRDEAHFADLMHANLVAYQDRLNNTAPGEMSQTTTSNGAFDEDVTQHTSVSDTPSEEQDGAEKRKLASDATETEGKKRRGDGPPKKPGRKPLTTEPTSKRKAQNRAAQRAFRERKEKHLKDLETKVELLEKASKDSKDENSLLKAQVARLQVELQEYKRRLSWLNDDMIGRTAFDPSTPAPSTFNPSSATTSLHFGTQPVPYGGFNTLSSGSHDNSLRAVNAVTTQSYEKNQHTSTNTSIPALHPYTSHNGILSYTTPQHHNAGSGSDQTASNGQAPVSSESRVTQKQPFTPSASGGTTAAGSKSASPSSCCDLAHSVSNTSSPGSLSSAALGSPSLASHEHGDHEEHNVSTTPTHDVNQLHHDTHTAQHTSTITQHKPLCESLLQETLTTPGVDLGFEHFADHVPPVPDFDWLVQQNQGAFDPTLFGDYRDPQEAYLSHDLDSFLHESPFDLTGSDFRVGDQSLPPVAGPAAVDLTQDDADAQFANTIASKYQKNIQELLNKLNETDGPCQWSQLSAECKGILKDALLKDQYSLMSLSDVWMRITQAKKFQEGDIDVDALCAEFKTKARCSESGVLMKKDDLEEIMSRYE